MASIQRLSSELIGQIAAGEVVERPASAVKELVENCIDAGATSVTVELRDGGISYLRVSDNGRGIPAEQLRLAFERHATSKLKSAEELYDIHTLGFRGEALASIAAVAKVTCITHAQGADFGARAKVEAGEFKDLTQAASPVGTTVLVEDLFFNAPVRLKFLKKPAVEAGLVADYMLRLLLSKPEISFRFVNQGKTIYHSMGDGKLESALFSVYGSDALKQMQKVHGQMNGLLLDGYVGVGELSRGNRQQQSLFVNGRYFKNAMLSKALENGCEGRVMIGRFPMCALFLSLPYQQVDVNVHPNKLEVRFQNEQSIAQAMEAMVREALQGESLGTKLSAQAQVSVQDSQKALENTVGREQGGFQVVALGRSVEASADESAPAVHVVPPKPIEPPPKASELSPAMPKPITLPAVRTSAVLHETVMPKMMAEALLQKHAYKPPAVEAIDHVTIAPPKPSKPAVEEQQEQTMLPPENAAESVPLRLVGIVFHTYWIFETGDRLLWVDQHAAHERILYDRLITKFESGHLSQKLLSPQLVRLTAPDMALCMELLPVLREAGFEAEPFDDTCVAVHAIPTLFGQNEPPRELFLEALDEAKEGRGQVTRERMRKQIAQMACKHAIKGGDTLNETEVQGFLQEMLTSDAMPTCPHGRPIVTEMTRYALEKRFKRVQ
ncbi:MAG: DNA mismatch repair endonuclease MutL [Clostridia bacterium]